MVPPELLAFPFAWFVPIVPCLLEATWLVTPGRGYSWDRSLDEEMCHTPLFIQWGIQYTCLPHGINLRSSFTSPTQATDLVQLHCHSSLTHTPFFCLPPKWSIQWNRFKIRCVPAISSHLMLTYHLDIPEFSPWSLKLTTLGPCCPLSSHSLLFPPWLQSHLALSVISHACFSLWTLSPPWWACPTVLFFFFGAPVTTSLESELEMLSKLDHSVFHGLFYFPS